MEMKEKGGAMRGNKETLQIFMLDGSMEVDGGAVKVGSQLISPMMNGVALPQREPTITYVHRELHRAPIKRASVHVETVDPMPPDFDPQFVLRDAHAIWNAARNDLDREVDGSNRFQNILQAVAVVMASLGLLLSIALAMNASEHKQLLAEERQQEQNERPVPAGPPSLPSVRPSGRETQ